MRHVENSLPKREGGRYTVRERRESERGDTGMQLQKRNKNKAHNKVGSGNISGCRKTVSWPTIKYIFMPKLMYVCVCVCDCMCAPVGGWRADDAVNLRFGVLKRSRHNSCSFICICICVCTYIIRMLSFFSLLFFQIVYT